MNKLRLTALVLTSVLALSLLTSCGNNVMEEETDPTPDLELVTPATPEEDVDDADDVMTPEEDMEDMDDGLMTPDMEGEEMPEGDDDIDHNAPAATPTPAPTTAPSTAPTTQPSEPSTEPQTPTAPEAPSTDATAGDVVADVTADILALEMPMLGELDADLLSMLYNIDASNLVSFTCMMPMMNTQASEFFVAEVVDGKLDTVKEGLMTRQANLLAEWEYYLPEQYELVKEYKLETSGNYIFFAVGEFAGDALDVFNSYTK